MRHLVITAALTGAMFACSDKAAEPVAVAGDADTVPADGVLQVDSGPIVEPERANIPTPTDLLMAGVADQDLGFPIGAGTVGYAPGGGAITPWSGMYPGTDAQHSALSARALVLRRQGSAIALVRIATIGIWQDMVEDIRRRLREEGRADLAKGLIITATHTHSSGGRVFDHEIGEIAVGTFLPAFYKRMRDAITTAVLEADGSAVQARIGHATLQVPDLHEDRRCENADIQDDSLGLLKVERTDGSLLALGLSYAMHGTVLGTGDWTLSSDAPGAVETGIEARLPVEAPVLYLQSWAGDMAPNTPEDRVVEEGNDLRSGFVNLDAIGSAAADLVIPALEGIATTDDPDLGIFSARVPLVAQDINPDGSFDDYPWGGLYCMSSDSNCGEDAAPFTQADLACLPFSESFTVHWTTLTAARIGDLGLVTLPGEPLTSVGVELRDRVLAATGLEQVFVVGYAQSYLAYLLHPDDYWMGGYEGASGLMGPGFGVYLIDRGEEIARRLMDPEAELSFIPVELPDAPSLDYEDLTHETALGVPEVLAHSGPGGPIRWVRWTGGDPAVDRPVVGLDKRGEDGEWSAALRLSGGAIDSRGPEIELLLETEPPYEDEKFLAERSFFWTARMPAVFSVTPAGGQLQGTYRFRISGNRPEAYDLTGNAFDL